MSSFYVADPLPEIPWHRYFAWHPVRTEEGKWLWLKYVCRKGISYHKPGELSNYFIDSVRSWQYKETIFDILKDNE